MMNRKKHLSRFNLVEIVLAIGVVALGMTAVLALLPPALNANRDSQGDSHAAEIASNMVAYIDKTILECAKDTSEFNTSDTNPNDDETQFVGQLSAKFGTSPGACLEVTSGSCLEAPFDRLKRDNDKMVYSDADSPDEAPAIANVAVWYKKADDLYNPPGSSPEEKRAVYRFYIKISWPAEAPVQERTFIHEVLRPVKQ